MRQLDIAKQILALKAWLPSLLPFGIFASTIIILFALNYSLSDAANQKDGAQNVRGAYNLARHGVLSFARGTSSGEHQPGNSREPLPIAALALHILLDPRIDDDASIDSLTSGEHLKYLKQHNLIWAFFCLLGVVVTVMLMLPGRIAGQLSAIVAMFVVYAFFLKNSAIINRSYTEIQAATLMVWLGAAAIVAVQTGGKKYYLLAGTALGALALTKASYAYVAIGFIIAMAVWNLVFLQATNRWTKTLTLTLCLFVAMATVTLPWMVRNKIALDTFAIAKRGGVILYNRALLNQMTDEEFRGVLIFWSPGRLRDAMIDHLGMSREEFKEGPVRRFIRGASPYYEVDRMAVRDGRPEDAVTYRMKARAESARLKKLYRKQGFHNATSLADAELQRKAIGLIVSDPVANLKTSVAFLWRGSWWLKRTIVNAAALVSLLALFVWGAVGGYREAFAATLFPVGCFAFYALATHFITRYSAPMVPSMLLSLVILPSLLVRSSLRRQAKIGETSKPSAQISS